MEELIIEKIERGEIPEVAAMLTEAFKTNPAYSIIFRKKEQLPEGLLWLFKTNLLLINEKVVLTQVVKEKTTGKIIGTFTIIPPEGVKNSLSVYSKIGIPYFISTFGLSPLLRMLRLDHFNHQLLTKAIRSDRYYYLHMVVVRKEYQGKGIGSFALQSAIATLITSGPTSRLLGLTTQLPENVVFYSRLGFDKLEEGEVDFKGDRYYNCNMKLNL